MAGLSTTGSISFGAAFVASRNLVPSPKAGITAFLTLATRLLPQTPDAAAPRGPRSVSHGRVTPTRCPEARRHYHRHGHVHRRAPRREGCAAGADAPGARRDPASRTGRSGRSGRGAAAGASRAPRRPDRAPVLFVRNGGPDGGAGPTTPGAGVP